MARGRLGREQKAKEQIRQGAQKRKKQAEQQIRLGEQGWEQEAEQLIGQGKRIGVALRESAGLIGGTPA